MSGEETIPNKPATDAGVAVSGMEDVQTRAPWTTEDPLETLLEMARRGEIDPWNIDIISVTDKFLAHLEDTYALNLRLSGRALLYASILLRMKSDVLLEEEETADDEDAPPWDPDARLPLQPRVLHPARRPATLYELMEELRRAERVKEHRTLRRAERTRREQQHPSISDAMDATHDKLLREHAEALWEDLQELFDGREFVGLAEIVPDGEKVKTYLQLLYLTHWRRLLLVQSVLFGELLIYPRHDEEKPDSPEPDVQGNVGGGS